MDADLMGKTGGQMVHPDDVMEKLHDIHGLGGCLTLFLLHQMGMETAHIGRATGRRGYYVVVALEELVILGGQRLGHLLETCVTHRLATAGLSLGVLHVETQRLQ